MCFPLGLVTDTQHPMRLCGVTQQDRTDSASSALLFISALMLLRTLRKTRRCPVPVLSSAGNTIKMTLIAVSFYKFMLLTGTLITSFEWKMFYSLKIICHNPVWYRGILFNVRKYYNLIHFLVLLLHTSTHLWFIKMFLFNCSLLFLSTLLVTARCCTNIDVTKCNQVSLL